jgi:hypothetical protein
VVVVVAAEVVEVEVEVVVAEVVVDPLAYR